MTYHQMYRRTTLGNTLQEALDEMVQHKLLQEKTALKVIQKFDQCISVALAKRVKNRLSLRGHLNTYRFCDNVWTFVMNDVEIKDSSSIMTVDKIKIVACEGKSAKQPQTAAAGAAVKPAILVNADRPKMAPPADEDEDQRGPYLSGGESE
ncbi:hypothetical protein EG68_02016 [Paragonimus skrjabini miyazakii]|uniref:Transcription initiation factor IIA subunit 2 n=1 Tax=Paragonimus skrjabini miyazakii TaxID=59628 RepID=A0A8S9YZ34_9TREM|nr:hypothetical protein EG68_02016 [Paragonimus skrjabini miyazakii]